MVQRIVALLALAQMVAAEHRGVVRFGGLPLPGASVTATQGDRKYATVTDQQGAYVLADVRDGQWMIEVAMQLFATQRREITVAGDPSEWEMELLPADKIASVVTTPAANTTYQKTAVSVSQTKPAAESRDGAPPPQAPSAPVPDELAQRAADGFLINGSVNNGASSPFALLPAFGNNRRGQRSLYNGNLGMILNHAAFDARAFSLTGQDTPKPSYSRLQGLFSFGGPIKIPRLIQRNGPTFTVNYQWTRNSNASTQTGLMPTAPERAGDFSQLSRTVIDPSTGVPFAGNVVPESRISPQARALLALYPQPNFASNSRYNYQLPLVNGMHQDDLQARVNKSIRRHSLSGNFSWQSTRTDTPDLFGFLDTGAVRGINAGFNYRRGFSPRTFVTFGLEYSRLTTRVTPFFSNRRNVSAEAGVAGNNQEPVNWGPPALTFSAGTTPLTLAQASLTRNQTRGATVDAFLSRGRHNLRLGVIHRRQQFNLLSQQDARGTFSFTGAAAGHDFAGFLLGIPDTSSIAFGNADKYLRARTTEAYVNDDWRVNPGLTVNVGLRWEYWSPVSERYQRLVNLEVSPGFANAAPIYTLPRPDRNNLSPRIAFSWRPFAASSTVVRGGYGLYFDTSVYQPIATQMAQQAPLSTSLRVSNTPETPLTLANGFPASAAAAGPIFGVDPGFRIGYSQNWQLSVQRDLPYGMQMRAGYDGSKGTRAQQQILPNTFPSGAVNPCADCPSGYTYLVSNGNASRHAGQFHIRRRLRSGFTASLNYTWAKSIDNATLGGRSQRGALIAQDWLNLRAERGLSNFDQRHLVTAMVQYTSGMGVRGGALLSGWRALVLKEWTLGSQITVGSGLPLTPVFIGAVRGTGVTGPLRPDYTGSPLYDAPAGFFLNQSAYAAPRTGQWGNAGRNSITGPRQFVLNATLGRTFRSTERMSLDLRIEAANAINNVTWASWNTVAGNAQFGLPTVANTMRTVQVAVRTRF